MRIGNRWIVPHWTGNFVVQVDPGETPSAAEVAQTERALPPLLFDYRNREADVARTIEEIVAEIGAIQAAPSSDSFGQSMRVREVSALLRRAAQLGRLSITPESRASAGRSKIKTAPQETPPGPAPGPAEPLESVEVLLCDQDGKPVANERYEMVLTDGTRRTGRLGAKGSVRIDGIPGGTCQVSFPGLDASGWELLNSGPLE